MENLKNLGAAIKAARKQEGLNQSEVSQLLGVSKRTLQDWEDGRRKPKPGYDRLVELIHAVGILTEEGRNQIITGAWDLEYALDLYKMRQVEKLSKWGAYGATYGANRKRIPASVWEKLPAEDLAILVDAIKAAYDDGVTAGKKGEE